MKKSLLKLALPLMILFNACSKDDAPGNVVTPAKGLYVLSEGSFGGNNSKLGFYDLTSGNYTEDIYKNNNAGATLGDNANDAIVYGGKMYIIMNGSNNVTIVNSSTIALTKKIDFGTKGPRYALANNGSVYVTAYDGSVSVIDTTSLTITKNIVVGKNPEGLAIVGNYLYVANSGGLDFVNGPDSTVSVVDLTTQLQTKTIKVGVNPNKVEADMYGNVYVTAYGNFFDKPASISVIDGNNATFKSTLASTTASPYTFSHVRVYGSTAYFYNNYYAGGSFCKTYNTQSGSVLRENFITDATTFVNTYGLNIDGNNGDVYITDSKSFATPTPGTVTRFDKDGKQTLTFTAVGGINPNKVLFAR